MNLVVARRGDEEGLVVRGEGAGQGRADRRASGEATTWLTAVAFTFVESSVICVRVLVSVSAGGRTSPLASVELAA
jgi:hypothetical protein